MLNTLRGSWTIGILLAASLPVFGEEPGGRVLKITVGIYNHANVSKASLGAAKTSAARILDKAGIQTMWLDCPLSAADVSLHPTCASVAGSGLLALKIVPESIARQRSESPSDLGLALLGEASSFANFAYVFFDRIEKRAKLLDCYLPTMLACVIAHEIGHLLLGAGQHSPSGIMRAKWSGQDLQLAETGALVFSSSQASTMKLELTRRMNAALPIQSRRASSSGGTVRLRR